MRYAGIFACTINTRENCVFYPTVVIFFYQATVVCLYPDNGLWNNDVVIAVYPVQYTPVCLVLFTAVIIGVPSDCMWFIYPCSPGLFHWHWWNCIVSLSCCWLRWPYECAIVLNNETRRTKRVYIASGFNYCTLNGVDISFWFKNCIALWYVLL